MTEINWASPPEVDRSRLGRSRSAEWDKIADELKANPNQWALIREETQSCYSHFIKTGRLVSFKPAGSFESTVRKNKDNRTKYDVYARYVGDN